MLILTSLSLWVSFNWFNLNTGCIFLFLCVPGTFYFWMLNIANFIMLCVRYFCFPLNILELCFGMKNDLKTIRLFQILFLIFVRQTRRGVHSQATYSHYWGKNLLCSLLDTAWILRFSSRAGRNGHYFRLCVSVRHYYLEYDQAVLSPNSGDFFTCMSSSAFSWTLVGTFRTNPKFSPYSALTFSTLTCKLEPPLSPLAQPGLPFHPCLETLNRVSWHSTGLSLFVLHLLGIIVLCCGSSVSLVTSSCLNNILSTG